MQQQLLLSWTIASPSPSPLPSIASLSWNKIASSAGKIRVRVRVRSLSSSSVKIPAAVEGEILPNALRRRSDPTWGGGGFSLGVDLGNSRTGLALGKGFSPRPLTVLELRGQKFELRLLDIAEKEEVDEFIIGLPKSSSGKETPQSNKVRSIAGRFAVRAAERGWRVYLQDEHGSSLEALDFMIEILLACLVDEHGTSMEILDLMDMGLKKSVRQGKIDAYSAMMVLERYFSTLGQGAELVLPKQMELQEKLRKGPYQDLDFLTEDTVCADTE